MLITWLATGVHYSTQQGSIAYISDVGADFLKPLFIAGSSITALCFFLSLVIERWLRHSGRLIPTMRNREHVFSVLAILGSFIGGIGLILLSTFDTKRHTSIHRLFLLIFMVGVMLSAIFTIVEYRWISKDFAYFRELRAAYIMKFILAVILMALAIAFGVCLYETSTSATEAGGILEWIISLGFTLYLLTFFYDLRMAKGVHKGELSKEAVAPYGTSEAVLKQQRV